MRTRTRITLLNEGTILASTYLHMDGHIENFAPPLILSLQGIKREDILKNRRLFQFFAMDGLYEGSRNEAVSYACDVDISQEPYTITVHGFGQKLLFKGTSEEFTQCYDELE
jgi:hypothetical protein